MRNDTTIADKFTSSDLAFMPDDGKRYEIIEGELYVSRQPGYEHQYTCNRCGQFLAEWSDQSGIGVVLPAPGVIFAEDDDVAPDMIWITRERLEQSVDHAGHLHTAPELVIEVLSPGKTNEDRDRLAKLKLYSRRGVEEYWIVSWSQKLVEVHRRENAALKLVATLHDGDTLETPLLPGFSCRISKLFL
jgi:Uma2 family endonuclease